jgi:hypothetical protein
MKAIGLSLLMLALALPGLAQTPGGPVVPAPQSPSPTPEETKAPAVSAPEAPAPSAPLAPAESPMAAANSKIVVPKDTTIPMILMNTINTRSAFVGQAVYCESIFPITVGNHIIIPKGSSIRGTVTEVIRPGHVKGRARLGLRFDELVLPNGTIRQLRATLSGFGTTSDDKFKPKEGQIEGGGSKAKDAGTIARTTIPGAEIGTIVGATKGSAIEGLGIGSAVGAATGVAWVLATRGKEIVLPYGTNLDLQLLQPVNFDRDDVPPPSRYDAGPMLPRSDYDPRN